MTNVTTAALFKLHIENMPEALNTKKDVDEYCKQFWKEYKEKAKAEKAAKADKPKRKKGFDKDGNPKEKRAPSAYNIFVKEKYAEIKEANHEMDKTQIFAEIARIWQELKADKAKNDKKTGPTPEIDEIQEEPSDEESPKKKRGRNSKKPEIIEAWNE